MSENAPEATILRALPENGDGKGSDDDSQQGSCLVVIHGSDLGRRVPIDHVLTIGRGPDRDLVLELDGVSRCHCRVEIDCGNAHILDEGSTNGTRLNERRIRPRQPQRLRSGDLIHLEGVILKYLELGSPEAAYHEEVHRTMVVDGLTQLYNRGYLVDFLSREMARCRRYDRPLALLMIDVDHFKQINDSRGHLAGDYVLRELARATLAAIRREACLARYGGEEFAIVSPETDLEEARAFGERIRGVVEVTEFRFEGDIIPVTVSVGAAVLTAPMSEPENLIEAADRKLYAAKAAGRNTVCT